MKTVEHPSVAAVYHNRKSGRLLPDNSFRRKRVAVANFLPESNPDEKISVNLSQSASH